MKPQKLSTKSNPSGEHMNLQEAFNQLKKEEHTASFENLGTWLDQNSKKPNTMKNIYKIAASFIFATMILIACTVPVQHEEEIGYMIKGIATNGSNSLVENIKNAKSIFGKQVLVSFVATEETGKESVNKAEIILMLPNADISEAKSKMDKLSAIFNFDTIDLLPIEEEREVPLYEAALSQININFGKALSEEVIIERFNKVLHENSNVSGKAELSTDEYGNKVVEIIIEEYESNDKIKGALNGINPNTIKSIKIIKEADGNKIINMEIEEEIEN